MLMNQQTKLDKQHYKIFALSWAGWVFDFYDLVLFTFLVSQLQTSLNFSAEMLSLCLGISLFATGLGGIIFGALGDKYGRKTILQWTIIIYSLGTLLSAFSWSFYSLVIFRFITGLGVGGEWATGQTYINETFPDKLRAKFGAFMQSGAPVGVILASIVGGLVSPVIGWRLTFLISILPALTVIYIRKNLNESDVWIQNKDQYINKNIFHEFKQLLTKEHRKIFLISLVLCIFGMSAYWLYNLRICSRKDWKTSCIYNLQFHYGPGHSYDNTLLESGPTNPRFDIRIYVPHRFWNRILWRIRFIILRTVPYKNQKHCCRNRVQPCTRSAVCYSCNYNSRCNIL